MANITTDLESFENIDYPKNIYELLLGLKQQPIEINLNNSSQFNYTNQEQPTGELWIDGKPIYKKVYYYFNDGNEPAINLYGKVFDLNTEISVDTLIDVKGFCQLSNDNNKSYINSPSELLKRKAEFVYDPTELAYLYYYELNGTIKTPLSGDYAIILTYTKETITR